MIYSNEREIRTKRKNMLICTLKKNEAGSIDVIKRDGKKEDSMPLDQFLAEIYGKE